MTHPERELQSLPLLTADEWQMSYGERAALEGIVAQIQPSLAIEIGTAGGGSLRRIAAYSTEVHSFDLVGPDLALASLENVTFHTGDSHAQLPQTLAELAAAGRSVDFVLVDGDHSADGVRRDLEDLLASDAIRHTVILLHDTLNDLVREGIEQAELERHPKVALVELDCVAGHLSRREPYRLQLWGGLGLVVVDAEQADRRRPVRDDRFYELANLVRPIRDLMVEIERDGEALDGLSAQEVEHRLTGGRHQAQNDAETARLRRELAECKRIITQMQCSVSWRVTAPLRAAKRSATRYRRP